jgi:DNA-binding MarR family transcriptional regulator
MMTGDPPISDDLVGNVLDFILLLSERLRETSHTFELSCKMSPQELLVLSILAKHGPLMVKDVASRLTGVSPSTLTRILDRLETGNMIVRTLNPMDRRSFRISLTDQGDLLVNQYHRALESLARTILDPLTPAERMIFVELQTRIENSLQVDLNQPAFSPAS